MSDTPENEALRSAIQGIVDAQLAMDSASRSAHSGPNTWRLCEETRVAYLAAKLKLDEAIANLARQHPQQDRAPQGEAVAVYMHQPSALKYGIRWLIDTPLADGTKLYLATPSASIDAAQPQEQVVCTRSHPHENMDAFCERLTEDARTINRLANAAQPAQPPAGWVIVPVIPTRKMVAACGQVYDDLGAVQAWRDMLAAAPSPIAKDTP